MRQHGKRRRIVPGGFEAHPHERHDTVMSNIVNHHIKNLRRHGKQIGLSADRIEQEVQGYLDNIRSQMHNKNAAETDARVEEARSELAEEARKKSIKAEKKK
jgi:chromosomal replication initiation ATPase DnaA